MNTEPPDRAEPPEQDVFQWKCPVCGQIGVIRTDDTASGSTPLQALRNHISFTPGDGHGPDGSLPAGCRDNVLATYIDRI